MPLISVVMPVYNCARYLDKAIRSILNQSVRDLELIIVDDGSFDGSARIIDQASARDDRVRIIRRANTGIVCALNEGLAACRSDFFARMDGDDIAHPERLSIQVARMREDPECVALGTGFIKIDSWGAAIDRHTPPTDHAAIEARLLAGDGSGLQHPTLLARTTAMRSCGAYDPIFDKAEDLDLYFRLMKIGRLANLSTPLLRYRIHAKSTNFLHRQKQKELLTRILAREHTIRKLPQVESSALSLADVSPADRYRQWACTSCQHGSWATAWRHALHAWALQPTARVSWKTLGYVWSQRRFSSWTEPRLSPTEEAQPSDTTNPRIS